MGRKKQAKAVKAAASAAETSARHAAKEARRSAKKEHHRRDRKTYTADQWAIPAPRHLVARLDAPKHKSKYQSYFEFTENTEKKEKKLEYKVTNDAHPPPGFVFVPIGDPTMTTACKELSREKEAMIFIVSNSKEENSKISEHIYRTGYHFREVIVEEARRMVGESYIPKSAGVIEPIPESQEEINKQADAAIRDLFPRIPNTDRQMIIEHAFQKGALFHGEPTVGLQTNIPLSRRVQLAVLAHIRHTHTRYDKLLRETSWMNARKAVEPVCLDVLVKWRGDEETGRDQMDEILREVVIITDSEDGYDSLDTDESSAEEGEVTSPSSSGAPSHPASRALQMQGKYSSHTSGPELPQLRTQEETAKIIPFASTQLSNVDPKPGGKKAQRGFRRYQAAWEDALHRRQDLIYHPATADQSLPPAGIGMRRAPSGVASPFPQSMPSFSKQSPQLDSPVHPTFPDNLAMTTRPNSRYLPQKPDFILSARNSNTLVRPSAGHAPYSSLDHRPLQPVRGHLATRGLQDLLVPSIEPTSSEDMASSSRMHERHTAKYRHNRPPTVIENSRSSPNRRPVIVVDDNSPQFKRRRVVHERESGHCMPVSVNDQVRRRAVVYDESLATSASFALRDDFEFRPSNVPPQVSQGLYGDSQPRDRIPAYSQSFNGGYAQLPEQMRRTDLSLGPVQEENHHNFRRLAISPQIDGSVEPVYYQTVRMVESADSRGRREADFKYRSGNLIQRPVTGTSTFSAGISSQRDSGPAIADQPFIYRFSESKSEPSLPQTRESFILLPERSGQTLREGGARHGYDNQPARPLAALHSVRARSPGRVFEDRSTPYREELRQPVFYELSNSNRPVYTQMIERQHPAALYAPQFSPRQDVPGGSKDLRHQIVVVD